MKKILLLSRYSNLGASSRYRCYQYLPYLYEHGWEVTNAPLLDDEYISCMYSGQQVSAVNIIKSYVRRIQVCLRKEHYDLLWIQQEAFPWIPYFFESILSNSTVPYVVDYDDPFFHRYDQHRNLLVRSFLGMKIDQVMRHSTLVIAGNEYIKERALKSGAPKVAILPTVVDLKRYPNSIPEKNKQFTIGWIGSPSTAHYLEIVGEPLSSFTKDGYSRLAAVGVGRDFRLPGVELQIIPWSEVTEVLEIQKFDVGIMPLFDGFWERGKCGFKLIQYMACSLPVIGSPVGVNKKIINDGVNGFQAANPQEWTKAFNELKNNISLRDQMGKKGRSLVEREYCLQVTAPKLESLFRNVVNM